METLSDSDFQLKDQKENNELPINVLQLEGPLFFGSIVSLMKIYNAAPKHKLLIIDMTSVTMIDLSGIYTLEDIIKVAKNKNIEVFAVNAKSHIKEKLEKLDFIKNIGKDNYKDSKESIMPIISNISF